MAEYEILQGSAPLTEEQMNNMPVQPETSAAPLSLQEDEVDIMVTGPSYDPTRRDVNAGRLFGKNALDATFKFLYDNPATADRALGKQLAASKDPLIQEIVKKTGVVDELTRTSEKFTAKSLALRDHFGMTEEEVTPGVSPLGWQKIVAGLGGASPSMLITAVSAGMGGAVATVFGAGEKIIKGAQLGGAAYASYSMEKPVLEKALMDAGFEAGFADRMSTYYAIPVAMLDAGSFGFLTRVMRPAAGAAVSTTIGRMIGRGILAPAGQLALGALGEGTTEAIQGQIQTEFEVGLGLQNRDFQNDLSSRVVEFVVGALMGGTVGTVHMSGQLQARKAAIEDTFQKYKDLPGISRSSIAQAYDASTLAATDRILDELGKDAVDANGITVDERAAQIQKAIDKAMGREADFSKVPEQLEKAKQLSPEDVFKFQEILQKNEGKIIDAKTAEIQKEVRTLQKERVDIQKRVAEAQRQLRLIKRDALVEFKDQEGRDPNPGELASWTMTKVASLESKISSLSGKVDAAQGQVIKARGKLAEGIKGLPNEAEVTALENQIEEANQKLAALQLSEDPKALTTAMELADQITALEEELGKLGKPEALLEKAEKAADEAAQKLSDTEEELVTAEAKLAALRDNALTEFVTEKNRPPKEGELELWKAEQIKKVSEEIGKLQANLTENLRLTQNLNAEAEGLRLGLEKVTGRVSIKASELRAQGVRLIRNLQRGFTKGFKLGIKEANAVARVAQQMIAGLTISDKAKQRLLRRVRSMSVKKFEKRFESFVQGLLDVKDAETVEGLRGVASDILTKATTVGEVNPQTIIFSEHLRNIFNGKVPAPDAPASDSPLDIAKYAMETLVADLAENETDVAAAQRSINALKDFYLGELENRLTYQARVAETDKRLADTIVAGITKGKKISPRQAGADAVRQNLKKTGILRGLFPTNWIESFLTIANDIDAGQKKPNMQGTMVREFDPAAAYRAWMTLLHRTREAIDYKLAEIYGPRFLETLTLNRTANFIDVEYVDPTTVQKEEAGQEGETPAQKFIRENPNATAEDVAIRMTPQEFSKEFYEHGTSKEAANEIIRNGVSSGEAIASFPAARTKDGKNIPASLSHQFGDTILVFRKSDIEKDGITIKKGAKPAFILNSGEGTQAQLIKKAISEGKNIPENVIKAYKDLGQQYPHLELLSEFNEAKGKATETAQGQEGEVIERVSITKGAAMSLYMMQRNPKIRKQLIDVGYSETWLDALAEGNMFTAQDHAWMNQVDNILKSYAEQIAPIYEKLTGKPFRAVDNYFMVQRYMYSEDLKNDEVSSVVQAMMDGEFDVADPSNDPRFKKRVISKKAFILPDITEAITRYSSDMNHFIAYAEYAYKLKALLSNSEFKAALDAHAPEGMSKILNTFLKHLIDGSQSRGSDRAAMKAQFTVLGWLARNKIASPRSGFMQFTALAGFTDPTASTPVNALELAEGVVSLFNAIRTGEVKDLLDTGYMQERWLGAFDQASKMAEDMARFGVFSNQGKLDPGGVLKKIGTNKMLQEWITLSTRLGDRAPSLLGGWTVYQKVLKQTGDKVAAVTAAIKMIEEVNGSLDPGKSAEIYQGNDMLSTLFKLFTRSTSIYLDRYVRMHKAFAAGQITKAQYAKGLALYHFWIPMFTSMVAMGAGGNFDDDELKTMMLAGPLSYHLLLGMMFKGAAAGLLSVTGLNEKFAVGYDNTGNLIDGYIQDVNSMGKKIVAAMETPDFEEIWAAVASVGKVGDITPLPAGYISRQPEAMYKILEGYWTEGIMEMMGYSSAATKVE